jgi:cytochrome oxidase assembly protein ShyY1
MYSKEASIMKGRSPRWSRHNGGMVRTLLAPRWLALHVLTLAVVAGMVWLGLWQYESAQAARERDARQSAPAVPIEQLVGVGERLPSRAVDRKAIVEGTWDGSRQFTVPGRVLDHTMGVYVVTPLVSSGGSTVLVVRGWVADGEAIREPRGSVTVTGTLRPYEDASAATLGPSASYRAGELPYLGRTPVYNALQLNPRITYDGYLLMISQEPPDPAGPEAVPLDVAAPQSGVGVWQHFSYWAQWWVFAAAALAFWVVLVRNAVRERQSL